jgi:hypothetical protein
VNRIEHHYSSIISINNKGLAYKDSIHNLLFIDFSECRKSWVRYVNSSQEFSNQHIREEETRCVGWRDAFDKSPYIEFFTEPRIRFVFPDKRILKVWYLKKGYKKFRETCVKIEKEGWSTFDLG